MPVSQRNRRERGEVATTWNRSNKAGRRNEIGQTAKIEVKHQRQTLGEGWHRNNKIIIKKES